MEIQGTIIAVMPTRNGTSKTGKAWQSASYVLQTQEMYPKKIVFDVMNENISQFNIREGEYLKVSFDINAREFKGKWYNSIKAWSVQRVDNGQVQQQPQTAFNAAPQPQAYQQPSPQPQQPQQSASATASAPAPGGSDNNLPF